MSCCSWKTLMCYNQPTRLHFESSFSELSEDFLKAEAASQLLKQAILGFLPLLKIWWLHPNPWWSPFYRSCAGSWIRFIHVCLLCLFKVYPDFASPPVGSLLCKAIPFSLFWRKTEDFPWSHPCVWDNTQTQAPGTPHHPECRVKMGSLLFHYHYLL